MGNEEFVVVDLFTGPIVLNLLSVFVYNLSQETYCLTGKQTKVCTAQPPKLLLVLVCVLLEISQPAKSGGKLPMKCTA